LLRGHTQSTSYEIQRRRISPEVSTAWKVCFTDTYSYHTISGNSQPPALCIGHYSVCLRSLFQRRSTNGFRFAGFMPAESGLIMTRFRSPSYCIKVDVGEFWHETSLYIEYRILHVSRVGFRLEQGFAAYCRCYFLPLSLL
jgi:hypothetical protein